MKTTVNVSEPIDNIIMRDFFLALVKAHIVIKKTPMLYQCDDNYFLLQDDKIGVVSPSLHGSVIDSNYICFHMREAVFNALACLYAHNKAPNDVPHQLNICIALSHNDHSTALIATVKNFHQIYEKIYSLLRKNQIVNNGDVQLGKIEDLKGQIQNLLGVKLLRIAKAGSVTVWLNDAEGKQYEKYYANYDDFLNNEKTESCVLEEHLKDRYYFDAASATSVILNECAIDLVHLDSLNGTSTFKELQNVLQDKKQFFGKIERLPCGQQQGQACMDHTAYNAFTKSVFNKLPHMNQAGAINSADLRIVSQNLKFGDKIKGYLNTLLMPCLKVENSQLNTTLPANELMIKNLRAYAKQLKKEYQKKSKILLFFCPRTKINKATRLEKLANDIEGDNSNWKNLVASEIKYAKSHACQSIFSNRTNNLLDNIMKGKAERGILSSKANDKIWVPGKARFW